jgi:glycyl-tRNA synthetase
VDLNLVLCFQIKGFTSKFEVERADVNREALEDLLKRRFFYAPAFDIYNGVKGLFDLGPPGCAVQAALVGEWRKTFVVNEDILELDATCLTPKVVLDVSGHTAKFCDFLVTSKTGDESVRADHLLEDWIDKRLESEGVSAAVEAEMRVARARADEMDDKELYAALQKYYMPSAAAAAAATAAAGAGKKKKSAAVEAERKYDDDWMPPQEFNLMFGTSIGPTGNQPGFLRPETAQGMFVNFRRLLDFANNKLPFGAAQIGKAFRNEINPRSGLLRVREFLLAEVEFFVHPRRHLHERFSEVADVPLRLFGRDAQLGDRRIAAVTASEAMLKGMLKNQTLAYFMARTTQFLTRCGVRPEWLRMRQVRACGACAAALTQSCCLLALGKRDGTLRVRLVGCCRTL